MNRSEKHAFVEVLRASILESSVVVVTHQSGLTVGEAETLRTKMRAAGASYKVVKNTLACLAIEGTEYAVLKDLLQGPCSLSYSKDPVAAAKISVQFSKDNEKLTIVGGAMKGQLLDKKSIAQLAELPSLDEMRAKMLAVVQAPATQLARVIQTPATQLARVVGEYSRK